MAPHIPFEAPVPLAAMQKIKKQHQARLPSPVVARGSVPALEGAAITAQALKEMVHEFIIMLVKFLISLLYHFGPGVSLFSQLFLFIVLMSIQGTYACSSDASACGAVSTVIVTVSGTPTTETINLAAASSAVISILSTVEAQTVSTGVAPVDTSTDITATVTKYLTYTEVFNIVEAPTTSATANQGSYYFSEQNGTTIWLGDKTPPTTDALVTGTTTVLVEPIPSGPSTSSGLMTSSGVAESSGVLISNGPTSAEGPADIKSFSTVFLTVLSTKQLTETLTKSTYTVPTSTRTFAGLGTSGWNSSAPTFKAVKVGPTGSGVLTQGFGQKGVSPTIAHASQSGYSYSLSGSAASDIAPKDKAARQVGAIVVATINGVAVSWTNQYDGSWNPISTISTISTPAQVAGPYGSGVVIPETTLPTSGEPCDTGEFPRASANKDPLAFTSSVPPVYSSELPFTSSPVPPPGSISFGGAIPLGPPSAKHLSTLSTAVGRTSLVSSGFASSVAASLLGPSTVISIGSPTTTVTEGVVAVSSAQAVVVTTAPFSNASSTTNAAAASSSCAGQFGNFTITVCHRDYHSPCINADEP